MSNPVTPQMKKVAANLNMNSTLQAIDTIIQQSFPGDPERQMGVLMMVQALTFARIRRKHGIVGKRRKIILDRALQDFAAKVKQYGYEDGQVAGAVPATTGETDASPPEAPHPVPATEDGPPRPSSPPDHGMVG